MRDPAELQEIENLGTLEPETPENGAEQEREGAGAGLLSLIQLAVCALLLLALVFFKVTDVESYEKVTDWYHSEMAKEIELPRWDREQETQSRPEESGSPAQVQLPDGSPQML